MFQIENSSAKWLGGDNSSSRISDYTFSQMAIVVELDVFEVMSHRHHLLTSICDVLNLI